MDKVLMIMKTVHCNQMYAGRKGISIEEKRRLRGGYNALMQTSLPEKYRCYDPAVETAESSHTAFTTTFPRGFAWEILEVCSGPPEIVYKFRHWGFMEGPFQGHKPTGDMIEFFGMAIFQVSPLPSYSTWLDFPRICISTDCCLRDLASTD